MPRQKTIMRHSPKESFRLGEIDEATRLATVRPRSYLRHARLLGYRSDGGSYRALSNRDNLALEALLTAYVQSDPSHHLTMHAVPARHVLALMPDGTRMRDFLASLQRLLAARMTVRMPDMRRTAVQTLRPGFDQLIDDPRARPMGPNPVPTRQARRAAQGLPVPKTYRHPVEVVQAARAEPFRSLVAVRPVDQPDVPEPDENGMVQIAPLVRFVIVGDDLAFELSSVMRASMLQQGAVKSVGAVWAPYLHLDLGRMRRFRSGFSCSLYRYLVDRIGYSRLPRRLEFELTFEDVATIAGLRLQKTGSTRGQVASVVLEAAQEDFDLDQSESAIRLEWRGVGSRLREKVRITIETTLAPLNRIRSRRIVNENRNRSDNVDWFERKLIARPDEPRLRAGLQAWTKIHFLLRCDQDRLMMLSEAYDLAVDELVRMYDPGFEPYSDGFHSSPCRGERLRTLIEVEGPARAAIHFALAEAENPDLSDPTNRDILRFRGAVGWASADRENRVKASRRKPLKSGKPRSAERVERVSRYTPEQIAEYVADRFASRDDQLAREQARRDEIAASRAARKERRKDEKNERRRVAYREQKWFEESLRFVPEPTVWELGMPIEDEPDPVDEPVVPAPDRSDDETDVAMPFDDGPPELTDDFDPVAHARQMREIDEYDARDL